MLYKTAKSFFRFFQTGWSGCPIQNWAHLDLSFTWVPILLGDSVPRPKWDLRCGLLYNYRWQKTSFSRRCFTIIMIPWWRWNSVLWRYSPMASCCTCRCCVSVFYHTTVAGGGSRTVAHPRSHGLTTENAIWESVTFSVVFSGTFQRSEASMGHALFTLSF